MENFTTNLRRKLNAVYKAKGRPSRSAKLRQLRKEVQEEISLSSVNSDATDTANASQGGCQSDRRQSNTALEELRDLQRPEAISPPLNNEQSKTRPGDTSVTDTEPEYPIPDGADLAQQEFGAEKAVNLEEVVVLQPEELQAIRDQFYINFTSEDESDYTQGPARIVLSADGIKHCAALLLTLELSAKIQKALRAQRNFAKARRVALRKKKVSLNFSSELERQIWGRKSHDVDETKKQILLEELAVLELMREHDRVTRQKIQADLEFQGQLLRNIQEEANAEIEEAFICAHLLDPGDDSPDTPIEELDLQEEYRNFKEKLRATDSVVPTPTSPLDTSQDYLMAPKQLMTTEQEREQKLKEAVWNAYRRLQSAQVAFDHREVDRAAEFQANFEAANNGEATIDATPEDFDLRWLEREQHLTRELIEAETALGEAKAAAVEAGVDVPLDDRASGFVDDVADGYRMSMEQEYIASVPSPKVKNWLSEIPELASPSFNERFEEGDEWEAKDVGISDSVSVVAEGNERRRIDKWRKVCGL